MFINLFVIGTAITKSLPLNSASRLALEDHLDVDAVATGGNFFELLFLLALQYVLRISIHVSVVNGHGLHLVASCKSCDNM